MKEYIAQRLEALREDEHPAVLGDKLSDLIYDILSALQIFSTELGAQDPLARIPCENLNVEIQRIYLDIEKILSEKVKICETTADDKAKKEQAAAQAKQEKEAKAEAEKNAAAQKAVKEKMAQGKELTAKVGELIAKKAQEAGITTVVFDRNGYLYHGRVKEVADAARNGGLKF